MRKSHIISAVAALLIAAATGNAANYRSVTIHHPGHIKASTTVTLSDDLTIAFTESAMTIQDGLATKKITIPKSKITAIEHLTTTAADNLAADPAAPAIEGGCMTFDGLPAGSRAEVYDASGRLVVSQTAEGRWTLPLENLGAGTFLIKVNGLTFKVATR